MSPPRGHERPRAPRCRLPVVLAAVGLLAASCTLGGQASTSGAKVPTQPQVLEVTMAGQAYAFDKDTLRPGRVVFSVANEGETEHDLALIRLPDDVAGVSQWLDSGVRGIEPVYTMADRSPGEHGVFAVDLQPGNYGLLCFVKDDDGTPHYRKGMIADFHVKPVGAPAERGNDGSEGQ